MASIFNIEKWESGKDYKVNDIVHHEISGANRFYYAINDSTGETPTEEGTGFWRGVHSSPPRNKVGPQFIWKASYTQQVSFSPKINSIKFGNGYEQRLKDGFNNNLLSIDLSFQDRSEKETTAIMHFLYAREGINSFYFKPPPPYGIMKRFVCKSFSSNLKFLNNFDIKAKFEEVP